MKKNAISHFAVLAFAGLALTACSTPSAEIAPTAADNSNETVEQVTISYWHTMSDAESAQLDSVIAEFESSYPGITVEPTRYAYDDFKTAITTGLAGDIAPDTARMDIAWVPEFADLGALSRVETMVAEFDEISSDVFPGPLSTNYWNDGYYGLPQNTNTQVLLWNKSQFEAAGIMSAPVTFDEFAADACQLTKGTDQYGFALGGTYFWAPAPLFYSAGGEVTDPSMTTAAGYVNGNGSVQAFTMLKDLYDEGCISPNLLGGGIGTADGHGTGLYSMIIDGPWMVDIYKGSYPDLEVNFAPVPAGAGGTSSVVGGENVVAFASSEKSDAAGKWMAYLLSEDAQVSMAQVGMIPTRVSLVGDARLPGYFEVFMEQLKTAKARVPHPNWGDMDGAISNAFQRVLNGDQLVQASLDQAAEEIDALLK
jgi:multiple sugar transport system substrate-binding protein